VRTKSITQTSWVGLCIALLLVFAGISNLALAKAKMPELIPGYTKSQFDWLVKHSLKTFYTPGAAVAVVYQNNVLHAQGYGVLSLETEQRVTPQTYFRIASLSKAFTATSIALLVRDGKLDWDTKVRDILPEFTLYSEWVSQSFTITDLLTHRSGLAAGAGDSMLWPAPSGFTQTELIHNLRYLTPKFSYQEYGYSNVMYLVAAEIVAKISGQPWAVFVDEHIMRAFDIDCFAGDVPEHVLNHTALPHGHNDERGIYLIPRNAVSEQAVLAGPAGGVVCSLNGMIRWMQLWLGADDDTNTTAFLSPELRAFMWEEQTTMPVYPRAKQMNDTTFKTYGLGWRKEDVNDVEMISHTGTLSGFQAYIALLPEQDLGVVVLNNGSNYGVRSSIVQSVIKAFIPGQPKIDWIAYLVQAQKEAEQRYLKRTYPLPQGSGKMTFSNAQYAGTYRDQWFGKITLEITENKTLRLYTEKMPMLTGTLEAFEGNTWVVRWDNQNAAKGAFLYFESNTSKTRITRFTMHPFQHRIKDDHAYRDMVFEKVITP
jgi:CubicO group peptidase (beta-lactamase class C family)